MTLGNKILASAFCVMACLAASADEAAWEAIDNRAVPAWFDEAKFGIFIHWGLYSVPSWGPKGRYAEWYWHDMADKEGETWKHHAATYGENFKYQDFVSGFNAELFEPDRWAKLFEDCGARYVVLTSKHHEGFCLWPSRESWNWNAMDLMPHRDLCGELTAAVKSRGLRMGFYYSLYEWHNPLYQQDLARYVDQHMLPQMKDLVTRYEPDIVWPDGEWNHPDTDWRSTEFIRWLLDESPVKDRVVINDRWGKGARNHHGDFFTTEYAIKEGLESIGSRRKWEECRGIGASFGYNRNEDASDYASVESLVRMLVDIVSHGGNLLLNIGPTADGRIPAIMQQRLLGLGEWLIANGEAIYASRPWKIMSEGDSIRYTTRDGAVYAIHYGWPGKELVLQAPVPSSDAHATMLGVPGDLAWRVEDGSMRITMPALGPDDAPCQHAYVFKLTGVQ